MAACSCPWRPNQPAPLQVRLSEDGQYLYRLRCEGALRIERLRIESGEVAGVSLGTGDSLCLGFGYGHPRFILPLTAAHSNDTVLVAAERFGFAQANFMTGTATFSVQPGDASTLAPRQANQPLPNDVLTLELGPRERTLATVSAAGAFETLQLSEARSVGAGHQDGRHLRVHAQLCHSPQPGSRRMVGRRAVPRDRGRRACHRGAPCLRRQHRRHLAGPCPNLEQPNDDPNWDPAFLAFDRQGRGLAVLRVNARLRATLSYYQLSPAESD